MARKKVKLAFIVNNSARTATYNKRKKSLLKKVDELSTLCGIEACAIVYSQNDPQPEVWPSAFGVQRVISKFRMMPELEKGKKMVNQETFLKERILKANEHLKKQRKENKEQEMTMFMFQCLSAGKLLDDNMSPHDLNELSWFIEKNLRDIDRRMEALNMNVDVLAPSPFHLPAPAPTLNPVPAPTLVPTPAPAISLNEEMDFLDQAHGLDMNFDMMKTQWSMDSMINGNGD